MASVKSDRQVNKAPKTVRIHPALYLQLAHEALDRDEAIQERVHRVLCEALGRDDLLDELARS